MKNLVIYAADIGSVRNARFSWARRTEGQTTNLVGGHDAIEGLAARVVDDLTRVRPVALGFEAPLWLPVPEDPQHLGRAREGEGSRPWSASAGATALATGIAEVCWILRAIHESRPDLAVHLVWDSFAKASGGRMFLWEAMVTGADKTGSHTADAARAAEGFEAAIASGAPWSTVSSAHPVFSIAGAALLWAGLGRSPDVLREPIPVIKP